MAEEVKEKLLEPEEVRQRIEKLKVSVGEMAAYIGIDERRLRRGRARWMRCAQSTSPA